MYYEARIQGSVEKRGLLIECMQVSADGGGDYLLRSFTINIMYESTPYGSLIQSVCGGAVTFSSFGSNLITEWGLVLTKRYARRLCRVLHRSIRCTSLNVDADAKLGVQLAMSPH